MRTRLDITLGGLLLILDGLICFLTLGCLTPDWAFHWEVDAELPYWQRLESCIDAWHIRRVTGVKGYYSSWRGRADVIIGNLCGVIDGLGRIVSFGWFLPHSAYGWSWVYELPYKLRLRNHLGSPEKKG